jgi:hypothetical protein
VIDRIGRFFSSLKLTVWILLALALVLALGTIYEAENGTPAVKVVYWRSWWFDALLVLLAANICGCTYYREPKRTSRWAYLLLHQSILIIFAGGLFGRWYGMEGQLQLREGEQKAELVMDNNVLNVTWLDKDGKKYDSYQFSTELIDAFPKRHHIDHLIPMPKRGVNIRVDRYYPDFSQVEGALPGEKGDGPAAQLKFTHLKDSMETWVFAGRPGPDPVNGLRVTMHEGTPPALSKDALKGGLGGVLELTGPGHSFHVRLDVADKVGEVIPVPNTPYRVKVERVFSNLSLQGKVPVDDPSAPENPAVLFVLEGPDLTDRRIAFANYPDFDEMHGRKRSGVGAAYRFKARELQIWREQSGKLTGRFIGAGDIVTGPLKMDKIYPIKDIDGLGFSIVQMMGSARPGIVPVNKSNEVKRSGIRVNVENDVGSEQLWLPFGETRTVAFGDAKAQLEYTKVLLPMKFQLKLEKFKVGRHPGTMQPASFASDVLLDDEEQKIKASPHKIHMNHPLVHRGYTFYQSSYVEGTPMISIFQVAYDPGGPVAYLGFFGFMSGLFLIIWSRPKRATAAVSGRES